MANETNQQQEPTIRWALPLSQAQYVLTQVAKAPYAECVQVMAELQQQAQASLQPQPEPTPLRAVVPDGE